MPEVDDFKTERHDQALQLFHLGVIWGGFESLVYPSLLGSIRTAANWPHKGATLRISVGLEHVEDLEADLLRALDALIS
jgi:cystathionine beta-lyase